MRVSLVCDGYPFLDVGWKPREYTRHKKASCLMNLDPSQAHGGRSCQPSEDSIEPPASAGTLDFEDRTCYNTTMKTVEGWGHDREGSEKATRYSLKIEGAEYKL